MRLLIDGCECPLVGDRGTIPGRDLRCMESVEAWREGRSMELWVELTPAMETLFAHAEELHRTEAFNDAYHHGEVMVDGVVLFSGVVALHGVEVVDGKRAYHIVVREGGADWADSLATTNLNATPVECVREMTLHDIEESWSDDGIIRMLPIVRDSYPQLTPTGIYTPQRMLTPSDCHPFIALCELLRTMVQTAGYTIKSEFLATPLAQRLVMSGAYAQVDSEQAMATMGFKALRATTTTATAAYDGRVELSMPQHSSSVGAVVDTISPQVVDGVVQMADAYTNGGCLSFVAGNLVFTPTREVRTAFDIHLNYTTDYRIVSSRRLQGFDRIYLGMGCYVDIVLHNRNRDMRNELTPGRLYTLMIFDYDPEAVYSIRGANTVTAAVTKFTSTSDMENKMVILVKAKGDSIFRTYRGDWALYEGHVESEGRCTVDVVVRTPYELLTPGSPKRFDDIYIEGAAEGQSLTLNAGCSITPRFGGVAGYGERITFEDVTHHGIAQADVVNAVAHMFNLRLYSHRPSRSLYIEPYDDFYNGAVVDWCDRQRGEGVLHESVVESFMLTRLGYQAADGVARRLMAPDADAEPGAWEFVVHSYATKQSVESRLNPLFVPTAACGDHLPTAPSAEMPVVGNRDEITATEYVAPRILMYHGLKALPAGEVWPIPGDGSSYPYAAFHSPEEGVTLCFDGDDGCQGLRHYHEGELRARAVGQVLTTDVYLRPEEYVALFDPMAEGASIRSRFRLRYGANTSLFHLEEVVCYDPATYTATCRFRRELTDN